MCGKDDLVKPMAYQDTLDGGKAYHLANAERQEVPFAAVSVRDCVVARIELLTALPSDDHRPCDFIVQSLFTHVPGNPQEA